MCIRDRINNQGLTEIEVSLSIDSEKGACNFSKTLKTGAADR
jgi:hypothetical protein